MLCFSLSCSSGFCHSGLSVAAQAQGFKPQSISGTISFGPPTPGTCSFQVDIFFQGKAGQINLPGGRIILTSPALRATLTSHSNPSSSVTLNTTGAFHQSFPSNGDIRLKHKASAPMHLKSYQIDGTLLRTGAANFSAFPYQDNNKWTPSRG
jgi:hypothetical protein